MVVGRYKKITPTEVGVREYCANTRETCLPVYLRLILGTGN
ncbi:hypothetical protein XSR1_20218 [Xenorhabdus szentirmaii DSM 16338]|uniref:Uncharacterized protein n=1 Tax=Xenorhabdus szentirmaii DSM 16338 TaxID=1427518 RepID=W1IYY3_9GAMM|nr:hypothetical protein XSR1_20218 [Xenorhabdus szentirmaii DSM 16338]